MWHRNDRRVAQREVRLGRDSPRESERPVARPPLVVGARSGARPLAACSPLSPQMCVGRRRGPALKLPKLRQRRAEARRRAPERSGHKRSGPGLPGPVGDRVAQVVGEQRRRSAGLGETARWCGPSAAAPKPLQHLSKCDNRCVTQAVAQQSQLLVISII